MKPHIGAWLSKNRQDLWGIWLALKYSPEYKEGIWELLSEGDKDILTRAAAK